MAIYVITYFLHVPKDLLNEAAKGWANGLEMVDVELSEEEIRALEREALETRNVELIAEISRAEAKLDISAAAERSGALNVLAQLEYAKDQAQVGREDVFIRDRIRTLPESVPLARELQKYLDFRRQESKEVTHLAMTVAQVAAGHEAECLKETGQQARIVFRYDEYEVVRKDFSLLKKHVGEDRARQVESKSYVQTERGEVEKISFNIGFRSERNQDRIHERERDEISTHLR